MILYINWQNILFYSKDIYHSYVFQESVQHFCGKEVKISKKLDHSIGPRFKKLVSEQKVFERSDPGVTRLGEFSPVWPLLSLGTF
jgi:hypothetical protein